MDNSEKCGYMFVIVFIIQALGLFWHPFGTPTTAWHVILWGIMLILLLLGYTSCEDYKKKEEDQEE